VNREPGRREDKNTRCRHEPSLPSGIGPPNCSTLSAAIAGRPRPPSQGHSETDGKRLIESRNESVGPVMNHRDPFGLIQLSESSKCFSCRHDFVFEAMIDL
jgi:hypothetical protein